MSVESTFVDICARDIALLFDITPCTCDETYCICRAFSILVHEKKFTSLCRSPTSVLISSISYMDAILIELAKCKTCEPVRDIVMSGQCTAKMFAVRFNGETSFVTGVAQLSKLMSRSFLGQPPCSYLIRTHSFVFTKSAGSYRLIIC